MADKPLGNTLVTQVGIVVKDAGLLSTGTDHRRDVSYFNLTWRRPIILQCYTFVISLPAL